LERGFLGILFDILYVILSTNIKFTTTLENFKPQTLTEVKNGNVVEHAMGEKNVGKKHYLGYV
jgi:hypothetical protein